MLYITDQFNHVNQFFLLLDSAIADIRFSSPIKMRTVKEFAATMELHPNYLNTLLKRHTGENVSSHIKKRLLEVSKNLLLETDWYVQDISYVVGFSDQPNFNMFFKKNMGYTPSEFRRLAVAIDNSESVSVIPLLQE